MAVNEIFGDPVKPHRNVDLQQVPSLGHQRALAATNYFLGRWIRHMTVFANFSNKKLLLIDEKIKKIEDELLLLEDKLSSIPDLGDIEASNINKDESIQSKEDIQTVTDNIPDAIIPDATSTNENIQPEEVAPAVTMVKNDPRFIPYFKMINFGVPPGAVKLKMQSDGFDPNLLDTPDAEAPPFDGTIGDVVASNDSSSYSST